MKNGSDSDESPPEELDRLTQGGIPGEGPDLEAAIRDAWGKRKSGDPRAYRVHEIFVWGNNPISGYRVIINPGG